MFTDQKIKAFSEAHFRIKKIYKSLYGKRMFEVVRTSSSNMTFDKKDNNYSYI